MKKVSLVLMLTVVVTGLILFFATGCKKETAIAALPVTDVDGNVYHTVTIGTQTWMLENLKTTHYRNGDPIEHVTDFTTGSARTTGTFCNYNNNSATADTFGRLYNWYAVADGPLLAPQGWHIPSDAEWLTLADYLGGASVAGSKLKEAGNNRFTGLNDGATNESGFTAIPGGILNSSGFFV